MGLIELALVVLLIICMWHIFSKAGERGWKSIIPFYGTYVEFKLFWETKYFWLYLIVSAVSGIIAGIQIVLWPFGNVPIWYWIILIIVSLCTLVFSVALLVYLGISFGKSGGFIVGLILLGIVFIPILAFGKSEYIGPKGEKIAD